MGKVRYVLNKEGVYEREINPEETDKSIIGGMNVLILENSAIPNGQGILYLNTKDYNNYKKVSKLK